MLWHLEIDKPLTCDADKDAFSQQRQQATETPVVLAKKKVNENKRKERKKRKIKQMMPKRWGREKSNVK